MKKEKFEKLNPTDKVDITIPQTIMAEKRLIEGDVVSKVNFEIPVDNELNLDFAFQTILNKGGRIFCTIRERFLIIHSEDSLSFSKTLPQDIMLPTYRD